MIESNPFDMDESPSTRAVLRESSQEAPPLPRSGARKLLVINQYYAPDVSSTGQLAAEICENLAANGIEVHVVTAQPSYTEKSDDAPRYEIRNGVHVHRIEILAKGRESKVTRFAGYVRFLFGAYKLSRAVVNVERPDGILAFHNPPFVGWIGAKLAKKYALEFTYAPYDIHPDVLIATGWIRLPKPLIWAWNSLNQYVLGQAKSVIALGEGMKNTLVYGKGVPPQSVKVIPLWGKPEFTPQDRDQTIRDEMGIAENELLLLYSGNMGIMHPLEHVLDAAEQLTDCPVKFVFVGGGAKRASLFQRAEGMQNVQFLPFQSEERFAQLVAASDACLVALEPGLERLAVPCRSFTFLSAARPLLTIMSDEADIAKLVTENNCGWNCLNGEDLAIQIQTLMAHPNLLQTAALNARAVYESRYTRAKVLQEYHDLLAA